MRHLIDHERLKDTLICSSAFKRIGRHNMGEEAETALALSVAATVLGEGSPLREHAILWSAATSAMALTEAGVEYDPSLVDALFSNVADLSAGDFDPTGEVAETLGLEHAPKTLVDVITGPLHALTQSISCWGPHRLQLRAA